MDPVTAPVASNSTATVLKLAYSVFSMIPKGPLYWVVMAVAGVSMIFLKLWLKHQANIGAWRKSQEEAIKEQVAAKKENDELSKKQEDLVSQVGQIVKENPDDKKKPRPSANPQA